MTLCLAASSTCSGLLEASAGLASDFKPSRNAFWAEFSSSHGVSKQPARATDGAPRTNDLRIIFESFESFSSPVIRGRAGRGKAPERIFENDDPNLGDIMTAAFPLPSSPV